MTEPAFGTRIVTVRGKVAEVYGVRFVLADNSGRALVEAGRGRGDQPPVATNQLLSVQGRFDHGVLHARYLIWRGRVGDCGRRPGWAAWPSSRAAGRLTRLPPLTAPL